MSDPDGQEGFEPYPYTEPEAPVPPPAPAAPTTSGPLVQRGAGPLAPVVSGQAGINRRGLVTAVIGVGLAGVFGISALQRGADQQEFPAEHEWPAEPVPVDDEPIDELVTVLLQTVDGDLGVEVPASWEVLREGDLVHLRHSDGCELVARVPDPPVRAGDTQLRVEADYTRARFLAEFVPDGDPVLSQVSEPPFETLGLSLTGDLAGSPGHARVAYLVDTDRDRGLVVAEQWPDSADQATVLAARSMVDQLQEAFRWL